MSLPSGLSETLPLLLKSRPARQIIEKKRSETITIDQEGSNQKPPYFVTDVEDCTIDFSRLHRLAQITIEDCDKLQVLLCTVIASIELVKCENIVVSTPQIRGTIAIDMSKNITLDLDSAISADLFIYTSGCENIMLRIPGQGNHVLTEAVISKVGRYRTWRTDETWQTARCNLYGDIIEDETP